MLKGMSNIYLPKLNEGLLREDSSFRKNKLDYILVYLLVATTGMNFFYQSVQFIVIGFLVTAFLFFARGLKIDRFLVGYLFLFFFIQMGQAFLFSFLSPLTFLGLYLRLLFAYFTIKLVDRKFTDYYINIIYVFTLISFVFYIPSIIFPGFAQFFLQHITPHFVSPFANPNDFYYGEQQGHIIIFNFNAVINAGRFYQIGRNSGPFWEPGAFGGFLMVAIIFNLIKTKTLSNKKNVTFMIAILTTFSTATYFVFIVFLGFNFLMNKRLRYKLVFLPVLLFIAVLSFNRFDFLRNKVLYSIQLSQDVGQTYGERTRFASAKLDLESLSKSPIFGLGRRIETRFAGIDDPYLRHRNNGLSYLLSVYGPVLFLFYFFLVFKSLKYLCTAHNFNLKFAYYALIIIMLIGFSESYYLTPFFYALTLFHLVISPKVQGSFSMNKNNYLNKCNYATG